jgi:MFS family permease
MLPLVAAVVVMVLVPRDEVAAKPRLEEGVAKPGGPPLWRTLPTQFYLALFLYFLLFALNQMVRLATPVALQDIEGRDDVAAAAGVAFTLGGVAAVAGVVFIGQRFVRPGRLRLTLIVASVVAAGAHVLLAVAHAVPMFIVAFALIALLQATMLPASNTLIAGNVPRERRGTGFGLAGSAQALAFLIGPMAAAGFAAVSIDLGFVVLGVLFLALALLLFVALREPPLEDAPA